MPVLVLRLTGPAARATRPPTRGNGLPKDGNGSHRAADGNARAGLVVTAPTRPAPAPPRPVRPAPGVTLDHWAAVVADSADRCLVLDGAGRVVAISVPAAKLIGRTRPELAGAPLLSKLQLLDFDTNEPTRSYAERIPPIAVLSGTGLMRGLLRVSAPDGRPLTVDAVAAPLRGTDGELLGSLTFLAPVRPG